MRAEAMVALGRLEDRPVASRRELATLLNAAGEEERALLASADRVRARTVGDSVHLRALLDFSNHCRRNCRYCGLRRANSDLPRYRMSPDEIIAAARRAANIGYRTIVLQSGEDPWYTAEMLAELIAAIKAEHDVAVTLSVGERPKADYRLLREAGADRFLLRIETSSPELYATLHPDSDWRQRLACLESLRHLGYQVGSGVMIGLPGQSVEMLADDLLFLQSLELDMIGVGPFLPHPATPLAGASGGEFGLARRFLALLRLLCPSALIPATTALAALDPRGWELGLGAGADVLMPDITPGRYRRYYDLYPGKVRLADDPVETRRQVEALVAGLGRRVAQDHGHSRRREPAGARHG